MKLETLQNPNPELAQFLNRKIDEFNYKHWEIKEKTPLAVQVTLENGEIRAGAAGKTFGLWLLIDTLWVSEALRGQNMGSQILEALEAAAKERGCQYALLDTLDFQAKPFYEKHGYKLEWTQENYPKDGCKYFMTKKL
jgi:GNAT superfamily N-acetyltransferase